MKNLIVYFTWSNNTKKLVLDINKEFNFDILRIDRKKPYSENYNTCAYVEAKEEVSKHIFPETGRPLVLREHLEQLKTLYENIEPTISKVKNPEQFPLLQALKMFSELTNGITGGIYKTEKNPLYPEESYEKFISKLIDKKKEKIERVLDLQ